ncbi:MAG: T9SS type A sorting domain-containing protein [Bacteroidia bacterium]|nr:T9SS type A sorting domain-containing protein [Bacteroidia bacterium]
MKRFYFFSLCLLLGMFSSQAQITVDGNITEPDWGTPLSQRTPASADPAAGFGADFQLNAFYADYDGSNLYFGLAGQVLDGNSILIFVDAAAGGYSDCNFGRAAAPQGINNINSGTTFDAGFTPEICICIENFGGTYFWNNYVLSGTAGSGGGPSSYMGAGSLESGIALGLGIEIGTNPAAGGSLTQGFEIAIPAGILAYTSGEIKAFAMLIGNSGFLSNQFLTPANAGESNYGGGPVTFSAAAPNPISYTPPTLPVELLDFRASVAGADVALSWEAVEKSFSHYEVERKTENGAFEFIGKVMAEGNSSTPVTYEFLDRRASSFDRNAYRLKMVDIDGSFRYSNLVLLSLAGSQISVSPNPSQGLVRIVLPEAPLQQASVQVFNIQGQLLHEQALAGEGQNEWTIDLGALPAGTYQVRTRWDGQQEQTRISLY